MNFEIIDLMLAFAGGIFGAAIGALPVWILCGLAVLIGATVSYMNGDASFMTLVAWGSFLGPHTSFTGGTAGAAYAAKKGLLANGRDICTPLMGLNNPKVLLVGGVFGMLGYLIFWALMQVPNYSAIGWTNHIALAVIVDMMVIRLVYGKTGLFGRIADGANRWTPTDKAGWVPYQSDPLMLVLLGICISIPASYLVLAMPGSDGIIFGFCTLVLIFMQFGQKVPVTHHIALSATLLTIATGEIAWGVSFGLLAAFFGEILACLFVYHGDTHIDPPTFALALTFSIYPLLDLTGLFHQTSVCVLWLVPVLIALSGWATLAILRRQQTIHQS